MICIGADTGSSKGAVVALHCGGGKAVLVAGVAWSLTKRKAGDVYRAWTWGRTVGAPDEHAPREHIAWLRDCCRVLAGIAGASPRLAVEGVTYQRNKGNQLPNAEQAARLAGWLEAHTGADAARPSVGDWRQQVLSIRRGTDGQDDAVARLIPALVVLPELPVWSRGHVLDACGVALWVPR